MLKVLFTVFVFASAGLAQSSADGSFSVHHAKQANFSLSRAQMREAESLYQSACAVVQHDFHGSASELRPHLTVLIGAERNEVHAEDTKIHVGNEIWLKKWDPNLFAEGIVVLAFGQMLTPDGIKRLGERAVRNSNATVNVADIK